VLIDVSNEFSELDTIPHRKR